MTAESTRLIRLLSVFLVLSFAIGTAVTVAADSKQKNASARPKVDAELERGVLQMVQQHLPEISALLDRLRRYEPTQYESAIRSLAKSSRRLQLAKKRGEEAFEIEVQIVQAQSSINLLIAKLTVRDNAKERRELKAATRRLHEAEIERARYELAQAKSRLERAEKQVSTAEKRLSDRQSSLDDQIEKGFQTYLRKSGRK